MSYKLGSCPSYTMTKVNKGTSLHTGMHVLLPYMIMIKPNCNLKIGMSKKCGIIVGVGRPTTGSKLSGDSSMPL